MRIVKWGVIGCGGIADRRTIPEGIIPADGSKLVAVMSRSKSTSERISKKYGVEKYYDSKEDLLRDPDVDAVYVATPNYLHAAQCISAADHGKHVLCEKPLAPTVEECEEIVSACTRNNVKLQVGFMMRFHACHQEALRTVKQGLIGDPVMGRAQLTGWYPGIPGAWRQDPKLGGGGCLMDMGIHCIDLLRMFLGEVKEVFALTDTVVFKYPVEDTSMVVLRFENKSSGFVDNFFNIPDAAANNRLEIYGTKGSISADGTIGQESTGELKIWTQREEKGYDPAQRRESQVSKIAEIRPGPINIYRAEIEHFTKCICEDLEPMNSGYEATRNQEIVLAAYESSTRGEKIEIKTPGHLHRAQL